MKKINNYRAKEKNLSITSLFNSPAGTDAFSTSLCSWSFPVEQSTRITKKENVEKITFKIVKVRMKTLNTCDSRRNLEAHKDNNHS